MGHKIMIKSGSLIELYTYEKELPVRRQSYYKPKKVERNSRNGSDGKGNDKRDRKLVCRHPRAIQRARGAFRRLIRANLFGTENPLLLTLTMFEVLSYESSSSFFHRFIARVRREEGKHFRYIAVPEFQKRGALHFHVMIWGLPQEYAETERHTRYFARLWLRGFCDCIKTDGHPKLVSYLTKYLSKHLQDLRLGGKKAYYASRNIVRPLRISNRLELFYDYKKVIHSTTFTERVFDTQWLGRCHYQRFDLT